MPQEGPWGAQKKGIRHVTTPGIGSTLGGAINFRENDEPEKREKQIMGGVLISKNK